MTKLSKILFFAVAVLIVASVAQTYWKTMVQKDFVVVDDVEMEDEALSEEDGAAEEEPAAEEDEVASEEEL